MRMDVTRVKTEKYWRCKCANTGVAGNYIPNRTPRCPTCKEWKNDLAKLRYE